MWFQNTNKCKLLTITVHPGLNLERQWSCTSSKPIWGKIFNTWNFSQSSRNEYLLFYDARAALRTERYILASPFRLLGETSLMSFSLYLATTIVAAADLWATDPFLDTRGCPMALPSSGYKERFWWKNALLPAIGIPNWVMCSELQILQWPTKSVSLFQVDKDAPRPKQLEDQLFYSRLPLN